MNQARERRRLIAAFDETRDLNFLRAATCLNRGSNALDKADILMAPDPKKAKGNPEIDDHDALVGMGILMELDGLTRWAAATKVASESPGHYSADATIRRLDRKFTEKPDEYLWLARQIASALKHQRGFDVLVSSIKKSHSIRS